MSKRTLFYIGGWMMVVLLMVVNQWHRAAVAVPAAPPHLHTQFVSVAIFAHLIVLSVWGGMMLHQYFDRADEGTDDD